MNQNIWKLEVSGNSLEVPGNSLEIPGDSLEVPGNSMAEEPQKAVVKITSPIFKTIFDRVKKYRIEKGLFRQRFRKIKKGVFQHGFPLSNVIWDLRDQNIRTLRVTVATAISQGKAATTLARDLKALTFTGLLSKSELETLTLPRGVYKSAYKNALRMIRTETNNAYTEAELEFAREKGYKKMWNVSPGHSVVDACDDLDGKIFDPDDVPYPIHPNDLCFLTTVIPEIG